jgi:hypothetical protein
LTLPRTAPTIMGMDSPGGLPLRPGVSGAGLAECTQAGTAYDKHPEAGP